MKKIGFFGGTFDPLHFGHLNLAIQMLELHRLDEVLFCPAGISPFKEGKPPSASKEDRLAMVSLGIAPIPQFSLLDWELAQEGPSYTIDTLRALIQKKNQAKYHLLIGEDALKDFFLWKEAEALIALAPPFIASRQEKNRGDSTHFSPSSWEILKKGMTETSFMEISSTEVRKRLFERKYCGHLVPAKTLDYIMQNELYY